MVGELKDISQRAQGRRLRSRRVSVSVLRDIREEAQVYARRSSSIYLGFCLGLRGGAA